jgi:hypothetical protein
MAERRNIGQILVTAGRVTEEDVDRALKYQSENGGFLGEALVALGRLTQEELEWSLASQFDLPYVFPDAESVDPEAVSLVTPEWALANLALPIMRTGETLTVVVDSPFKSRAVEELQARTDLEVQLALASSWKIRELVRQVYARKPSDQEAAEQSSAVELEAALGSALATASGRFGISRRGSRAWFWHDARGTVRRRPLDRGWKEALDQLVSPALSKEIGSEQDATVEAELVREGIVTPVEVRYLASGSGEEYVFRPRRGASPLEDRFHPPPPGILSEVRLLARSGSARFLVRCTPEDLGREIIPHLPALLLDPSWRSVHVVARDGGSPVEEGVFSLQAAKEADAWKREAEGLRAFHFDAVSVDPTGADPEWPLAALEMAAVAFILWDERLGRRRAHEAGIRWELGVARAEGQSLDWRLDPLKT